SYNIYFENVKSSNAGILTAIFVLVLGANYERDINNIKTIQLNAMHALCMHYLRLYYLYFLVLAGFYSKDILEIISLTRDNFFFFSTGLPVVYSFRLVFYSIIGELNFFSLNFSSDEGWIVLRQKNRVIIYKNCRREGGFVNIICLCYWRIFIFKVSLFGLLIIPYLYIEFLNIGDLCDLYLLFLHIEILDFYLIIAEISLKSFGRGRSEFFEGENGYSNLNNNFKTYIIVIYLIQIASKDL
uniref:NADH:ubiquinone reductase (H(+)-translocating) n=1 Tax=Glossina morsitans morsitans TaxID=37546 RepID=A0A1B0FPT7_GLOMM